MTSSRGTRVRTSPDLVNWREQPLFTPGGKPGWIGSGKKGRVRPRDKVASSKIHRVGNEYVLIFGAANPKRQNKKCLGRAFSQTPFNFDSEGAGPPLCEKNRGSDYSILDPDLFLDPRTNQWHLLYKRQLQSRTKPKSRTKVAPREPSDIAIRPIDPARRGTIPKEKVTQLVPASGRGRDGFSVEAPTMVFRQGERGARYYLFYSIGDFTSDAYGVSVAVSPRNAAGPAQGRYVKFRDNPIYSGFNNGRDDRGFCGVGHQDVLPLSPEGGILFAHAYLGQSGQKGRYPGCATSGRRQLIADALRWNVPSSANNNDFGDDGANFWPSVNDGSPPNTGVPQLEGIRP